MARLGRVGSSHWRDRWADIEFVPGTPSPFGVTEVGNEDYRGICFTQQVIADAVITDADFTAANLSHLRLENCVLQRCDFARADLTDLVTRASQFEDCNFNRADLRAAQIGFHGTDFCRCKFDGARSARIGFFNAVFTDVKFIGSDWSHTDFRASGFWNCIFNGTMQDVTFRGDYLFPLQREIAGDPKRTGLHNVSFHDAELHWVDITNDCVLENITLPADSSAFVCEVTALNSTYANYDQRSPEYEVLSKYLRIILPNVHSQRKKIVSKFDLMKLGGTEIGTALYDRLKSVAG